MKHTLISVLAAVGLFGAAAGASAAGVSINLGEPGFYGHIVIGDAPPPRLIYAQPVIVERGPNYMRQAPVYLRVPAGYQSNWKRHCRAYNACGQRVYFVQDNWYRNQYAPHYRQHHGRPPAPHYGQRNDHRDDHRGNGHGPGPRHDRHDNRHDNRPDQRHDNRHDNRPGNNDGHHGNDRRGG